MRVILLSIFFITSFIPRLIAQDTPKIIDQAVELAKKGEHTKSLELATTLYDLQPHTYEAYSIIAYNQICLGNLPNAALYLAAGLQVEPTEYSLYVSSGYYQALIGDTESAKNYFRESIKFYPEGLDINVVLDEMRSVGVKRNQAVLFNGLADWYKQTLQATKQRYPKMSEFEIALGTELRNPIKAKQLTQQYAAKFNELGWQDVAMEIYSYSSLTLEQQGYYSDAVEMAQAGYQLFVKNNYRNNTFIASFMLNQLMAAYVALGNDERAIQHLDEMVNLSPKIAIHYYDVLSIIAGSNAYYRLQKPNENLKWAIDAYNLSLKGGFSRGRALAAETVSVAYANRRLQGDGPKAVQYAEESLRIALEANLESIMSGIIGNLALRYMSVPTRESQEKAIYTMGQLAGLQEMKKMYADASATWNNIGAIFYFTKSYEEAANNFEKSVSFAQAEIDQLNMSTRDKLTFYQSQISGFDFLTACYANLNKPEDAFRSMEGSRSRVLNERMAKEKNVSKPTIHELQDMLQPDEACIMYDLFSGHEVSILVVTKKGSQVIFHKDDSFIGDIKEKYLDKLNKEHSERGGIENTKAVDREARVTSADFEKVTQLTRKFFEKPGMADDILNEYLRGYYRFLILPIANRLTGIRKLIISPDDVLNFIPFEALQMQDGKYLVEKFEVKYMHSTSVLKQIQDRKYAANRKPLLAMGGAKFETMMVDVPELKTQRDLNTMQLEVEENIRSSKSQRRAYAALFGVGPMNDLPGTIEEVNSISKTVPNAETYLGADMSENRIKAMAKSGALGQYKVLHLATHGFVVNDIPDLSGVAMSISPTEQDGEDGFLNVNEIGELNLHSDLTVLSACQTALGKIYSGEGVTGLTQSLLIAGSNAALVSLWPVDDKATMLFMSGLYKESLKGKPYAQISNELKRKFIKGEFGDEFKHPNFWAPFVYYGN
jgi:CHAT domain-containing protein/tetratricopeptide (TPR) repeat protein